MSAKEIIILTCNLNVTTALTACRNIIKTQKFKKIDKV